METVTEKPRRRWRVLFSIRTLMAVVLIVAGLLGWKVNRAYTQRQAVAQIRAVNGGIVYDFQNLPPGTPGKVGQTAKPAGPDWLRRWVGDEYFQEVAGVTIPGPVTAETLRVVGSCDHLESLQINAPLKVSDGLEHLAGLTRLKRVILSGPAVDDALAAQLLKNRDLEMIRFYSSGISDAGVLRMAGMAKLKFLTLNNSLKVTDASIIQVAPTLTALTRLDLSRTGITDESLASVGRMSGLKSLALDDTQVTDQGLAHLKGLSGLEWLNLNKTKITDAGLPSLAGLTSLLQLTLCDTNVTGSGFEHLDSLQNLIILDLDGSQFGDEGMPYVARLARLQSVGLARTQVTDAGLPGLQSSPGLVTVQTWETRVTDAGLAALQKQNPRITQVMNQSPGRPAIVPR